MFCSLRDLAVPAVHKSVVTVRALRPRKRSRAGVLSRIIQTATGRAGSLRAPCCQPPNPGKSAGFGHCSPAGGWLRWNPHPLDEAPAGSQGQRNHRNVTGVLRHHRHRHRPGRTDPEQPAGHGEIYHRIASGPQRLAERVNRDIAALDEKLSRRIAALDEKLSRDISALGERIARLEGFMEASATPSPARRPERRRGCGGHQFSLAGREMIVSPSGVVLNRFVTAGPGRGSPGTTGMVSWPY